VHDSWQKITAPGKMHRLKAYLLAQSPYRRSISSQERALLRTWTRPEFWRGYTLREQLASIGKRSGGGYHAEGAIGWRSEFGDSFAGNVGCCRSDRTALFGVAPADFAG